MASKDAIFFVKLEWGEGKMNEIYFFHRFSNYS